MFSMVTEQHYDSEVVDVPSITEATEIVRLRGGDMVIIHSLASTGKGHFIGQLDNVERSKGFKLMTGEELKISLPLSFGVDNEITIYAMSETAGDDVTFLKIPQAEKKQKYNITCEVV